MAPLLIDLGLTVLTEDVLNAENSVLLLGSILPRLVGDAVFVDDDERDTFDRSHGSRNLLLADQSVVRAVDRLRAAVEDRFVARSEEAIESADECAGNTLREIAGSHVGNLPTAEHRSTKIRIHSYLISHLRKNESVTQILSELLYGNREFYNGRIVSGASRFSSITSIS